MQYWLGRNGQKLGPYTIEDLRGMAAHGGAVASDLLWAEGMPNWVPLFSVIQQQQAAPPPAYAPSPVYAPQAQQQAWQPQQQPQYQMPMAQVGVPANAGLMPPNMHWALVLLISYFTGGIFQLYWLFKEASFVKRLDQSSKAISLLVIGLVGPMICGGLLVLIAVVSQSAHIDRDLATVLMVCLGLIAGLVSLICSLRAMFSMRSSIQNYYNSVEPIGLRLSGVMTFFFNILYFQHHFSRIAKWKMTGFLEPQG